MPPKLNRELFVLGKIDEILAWEQRKDTERDTKFVELGPYLRCGKGSTGVGETQVVGRVSGEKIPGVRQEALLSDVHRRESATTTGATSAKGDRVDKRARLGKRGKEGPTEVQLCNRVTWLHKAKTLLTDQCRRDIDVLSRNSNSIKVA